MIFVPVWPSPLESFQHFYAFDRSPDHGLSAGKRSALLYRSITGQHHPASTHPRVLDGLARVGHDSPVGPSGRLTDPLPSPLTGAALVASARGAGQSNLLRRVDAPAPRFMMLEIIREYAAERLADMPQEAAIRESRAAVFCRGGRGGAPSAHGAWRKGVVGAASAAIRKSQGRRWAVFGSRSSSILLANFGWAKSTNRGDA